MKLSGTHRKRPRRPAAGGPDTVRYGQLVVPTRPRKAYVAAVTVLLGLIGIHITSGTAQALVMVGQLVAVVYGVWRTYNPPKPPDGGRGVQDYL